MRAFLNSKITVREVIGLIVLLIVGQMVGGFVIGFLEGIATHAPAVSRC